MDETDELGDYVSCTRCGRVHHWRLSRRGWGDWGHGAELCPVICPACIRALDNRDHQVAYREELERRRARHQTAWRQAMQVAMVRALGNLRY